MNNMCVSFASWATSLFLICHGAPTNNGNITNTQTQHIFLALSLTLSLALQSCVCLLPSSPPLQQSHLNLFIYLACVCAFVLNTHSRAVSNSTPSPVTNKSEFKLHLRIHAACSRIVVMRVHTLHSVTLSRLPFRNALHTHTTTQRFRSTHLLLLRSRLRLNAVPPQMLLLLCRIVAGVRSASKQ